MAQIHWKNSAGGDFSDAADWSGGVVPGAADRATIAAPGTYTVTVSSDEAVRSLTLNDPTATVVLGLSDESDPTVTLTLGSAMTLSAGTFELNASGRISGGTLSATGGVFHSNPFGTLDGVTYDGPLNLSGTDGFTVGAGGLILKGAGGAGPGALNLAGSSNTIFFHSPQTFDNATIDLGSSSEASLDSNAALTLGPALTLNATSPAGSISDAALVNEGAINAAGGASHLVIDVPGSFTNQGTISASDASHVRIFTFGFANQGTITVSSGAVLLLQNSLTNLARGTLTGGLYEVDAGSRLQLPRGKSIVADDATIILSGAGSTVQGVKGADGFQITIDASLRRIGASGTLELLAGRNWTSAQAVSNFGVLELGGGTFAPAGLANNGRVSGFGTIGVAVANAGVVEAADGTLDVTGAVTGAGSLTIDAGATLELDSSAAKNQTATFAGAGGTLAVGAPGAFLATIAGFGVGETLDLLNTAATSAVLQAGDRLAINNGATTIASLQLAGDYLGDTFAVASDGHGGSNITLVAPPHTATPPAASQFVQAMSAMGAGPAGHGSAIHAAWSPRAPVLVRPNAAIA